ncbi:MAG: molybdate ABC transporter substrate-binding protein [Myxococcota bacterium]
MAAASSLRAPLTELARRFEETHPGSRVALSFGASSWLAVQIRAGAPVDVFLSADARQVAALSDLGLLLSDRSYDFASNRLVVVVSRRADFQLETQGDLARPELRRFALPPSVVPLGHYGRAWLQERGLLAALQGRTVQSTDARATLAAVELGQADAALVYATDAALSDRVRVAFRVPESEQPSILYVAALTPRGARHPAAEAFLRFLRDPGATLLEAAGFLPSPSEARP